MKIHLTPIATKTAWPEGQPDPDQIMVDTIAETNPIICKSCEKEFDSDGLIYCNECRKFMPAYNNYDIEDL